MRKKHVKKFFVERREEYPLRLSILILFLNLQVIIKDSFKFVSKKKKTRSNPMIFLNYINYKKTQQLS